MPWIHDISSSASQDKLKTAPFFFPSLPSLPRRASGLGEPWPEGKKETSLQPGMRSWPGIWLGAEDCIKRLCSGLLELFHAGIRPYSGRYLATAEGAFELLAA